MNYIPRSVAAFSNNNFRVFCCAINVKRHELQCSKTVYARFFCAPK
jgi:hypothetical protein